MEKFDADTVRVRVHVAFPPPQCHACRWVKVSPMHTARSTEARASEGRRALRRKMSPSMRVSEGRGDWPLTFLARASVGRERVCVS